MSIALPISGTIHHVTVIYGKQPKMIKNSVCLSPYPRNRTSYDCDFCYTCVKWWYLQQIFSFFKTLIFGIFRGRGKRGKNDLKLPISVCFALYHGNCRSYHRDFDNDIYSCFSLFFLKKCNIVNIKITLFFIGPLQQFF